MDFTQSFLQGVQQGQQRAAAKQREEREAEEFDLKKQMLKVEMQKLDIAQKIAARKATEEGGENWAKRDAPAQAQPTGGVTPTGGPMPAVNVGMVNPAQVPVDLPEAPGMPAVKGAMYPTLTGTRQYETQKANAAQARTEALSQVFVPGVGLMDKEVLSAMIQEKKMAQQSADLNTRLEAQANNIAAQIAAAQARTEAQIAAGDRRAAANNAAAERRLFLQGKAISATKPETAEAPSFINQPGFNSLPPPERTKAVMMNGIISMAKSYRDLVQDMVGPTGIKLMGEDAAVIEAIHAKLMFEGAAGFGQGALQAPDLAQMKKTFYDPTSLKDAFGTTIRGQKEGRLKAMDKVIEDLAAKMKANYGLTPSIAVSTQIAPTGLPTPPAATTDPSTGARPRRRNPTTGEVIEFDGAAWVPVKQ